jgi:hypothetical protein
MVRNGFAELNGAICGANGDNGDNAQLFGIFGVFQVKSTGSMCLFSTTEQLCGAKRSYCGANGAIAELFAELIRDVMVFTCFTCFLVAITQTISCQISDKKFHFLHSR